MRYEDFKKEMLKDPEVKKEYDALQPEFELKKAMIQARESQHLTQKELSKRSGISQSNISKIENGTRNPSLAMLQRLADAMNMRLKLTFVPKNTDHNRDKTIANY